MLSCFPETWANKWRIFWQQRHAKQHEASADGETGPLIPPPPRQVLPQISVTTDAPPSTGDTFNDPSYGTFETPSTVAESPSPSPDRNVGKATPTEATDVRSVRSLGKRDSPNLEAIRIDIGQDIEGAGGQFEAGHEDDAVDFEDGLNQSLEDRLWNARIEWPNEASRYFIPVSELRNLLSVENIYQELVRCKIKEGRDERLDLAKRIWDVAPRLFAILVCMNKTRCIVNFLQEDLVDEDLPFKRTGGGVNSFKLCSCRTDKRVKSMSNWGRSEITTFGRDQWWMLAPVFKQGKNNKEKVRHWALDDNCVLPFIEDTKRTKVNVGGFSSVWGVLVHPAHQLLYKSTNPKVDNPLIALKRLHSTKRKDFELEVETLKAFSHHKNPHLVKLLATFSLKNRYYLVFPYATANLRSYWERTPLPAFSRSAILWSLQQCKGIASGLMAIHEYKTSQSEKTDDNPTEALGRHGFGHNLSPDVMPLPAENERRYGRHGDIKPENILWTDENVRDEGSEYNEQGLLLIADFGLVDFHGRQTRSQVPADKINGSPSYEPPERRLGIKISRAYDIWSLGCVYLEFITWLVSGWDDLDKFPDIRGKTGLSGILNDDTFFTIIDERPSTPLRAIVRESVTEWIKDLHEKPRCSQFIHDFLDLVSNNMLLVEASQRIPCGPLNDKLKHMVEKAENDSAYLTTPVPRPPRERNQTAIQMSATLQRLTKANQDSPPPSPTEGRALPRSNVPHNLNAIAASPPTRAPSPMFTFSAEDGSNFEDFDP